MPKAKNKTLSAKEIDEYLDGQYEKMAVDLGLGQSKRRESVWYYPRRDPKSGAIPRKTQERKRSKSRADNHLKNILPETEIPIVQAVDEQMTEEDDMNALLGEIQDSLGIDLGTGTLSSWSERQEDLEESWASARPTLMKIVLKQQCPNKDVCSRCLEESASVKCKDCRQSFCGNCDMQIHSHLFLHDREGWKNGHFYRLPPVGSFPVMHPDQCSHCGVRGQSAARLTESVYIAITLKGRRSIPRQEVVCENCGTVAGDMELKGLIANGFWPGTLKRIRHIYEVELLKLIDMLLKNMPGTSVSALAKALQDLDEFDCPVNKLALTKALAEYRYCSHAIEQCQGIDGMSCPACSRGQLSAHVDGNFKTYRYSKVPRGSRKPYYGDVFIEGNDKVKRHMETVYEKAGCSQDSNNCGNSHWRAAKSSARGRNKLDECGLEVAGCRHAIAQKAVNMFTGEQYGFPHYIHVTYLLPLKVRFMWQDVVCKYWPWAIRQATKDPAFADAVQLIKPALSIMHGKAHQWSCQVVWGGRNQEGSCAGAGEDMEQFFSYLSRLGSTTKNMSYASREDTITEHVLFWNKRKADKMAQLLSIRYQRNAMYIKVTAEQLTSLHESIDQDVLDSDLVQWQEEIVQRAKEATVKDDIPAIESEIEAVALSIRQRKHAIRRFADSCKQRARLRRKNDQEGVKLDNLLDRLSSLPGGVTLSRADAVEGNFPWNTDSTSSFTVPYEKRKQMVDLWTLSKRLQEEEEQLRKEIRSVLLHLREKLASLQEEKFNLLEFVGEEEGSFAIPDTGRYTIQPPYTEAELKGIISMKDRGIQRIIQQLTDSVVVFTKVLNGTLDDIDSSSSDSEDSSSEC